MSWSNYQQPANNFQMNLRRNNNFAGTNVAGSNAAPKLYKEVLKIADPSQIEVGVSHRNNFTEPYMYLRSQDGRHFISMNISECADLIDILTEFAFPAMTECQTLLKQAQADGSLNVPKKAPVRVAEPSKFSLQIRAEREQEVERARQQHQYQFLKEKP